MMINSQTLTKYPRHKKGVTEIYPLEQTSVTPASFFNYPKGEIFNRLLFHVIVSKCR